MNYDKYFREMGSTVVVTGFKGFFVFSLVRRTSKTLLPMWLTLFGWAIGFAIGALADAKPWKLPAFLLVTFALLLHGAALSVLTVISEWTALVRSGAVKNAPRWDTWQKWQEEKRKK